PQPAVEAIHLQQAQWLGMVAKLAPGPDLEQLFQGAEPAGQGDEGVGQFGHACLARVHTVHHFQVGQATVADFGSFQALRDDADDLATGIQCCIGDYAHQADSAAAVYQPYAPLGQVLAKCFGGLTIDGTGTGAGTTEDADTTQGHGQTP